MKTHSHTQASADTSDHFTKNKCTKKSLTSKKKMWQVIRAGSICPIFQVVRISSVHTHPDPDCAASRSSFFKGEVFWYYGAPQGPISSSGARFLLRGPVLAQWPSTNSFKYGQSKNIWHLSLKLTESESLGSKTGFLWSVDNGNWKTMGTYLCPKCGNNFHVDSDLYLHQKLETGPRGGPLS